MGEKQIKQTQPLPSLSALSDTSSLMLALHCALSGWPCLIHELTYLLTSLLSGGMYACEGAASSFVLDQPVLVLALTTCCSLHGTYLNRFWNHANPAGGRQLKIHLRMVWSCVPFNGFHSTLLNATSLRLHFAPATRGEWSRRS